MLRVEEIFWRMAQHREFDASEFSLRGYVVRRGRGADDLVAIPVFPSRFFRQSCIFVHDGSGIRSPEDLRGKRVGVPEYQMTAAVWARGILADGYGVRAADVEWVQGGLEEPGRIPFEPAEPAGVTVGFAPTDRSLAQMLESGRDRRAGHSQDTLDLRRAVGRCGGLFEHPSRGRARLFPPNRHFSHHAHPGGQERDPRRKPRVRLTLFGVLGSQDLAMADLTQTARCHSVYRSWSSTPTRP
jgi:hypothetical protein